MIAGVREKASAIRIALGRGVYVRDEIVHRSCAARTLAGLLEDSRAFDELAVVDAVAAVAQGLLQRILRRIPSTGSHTNEDVPLSDEGASGQGEDCAEQSEDTVRLAIGIPESSITFSSMLEADTPGSAPGGAPDRDAGKAAPSAVLTATRVVAYGKTNIRVSARVRSQELRNVRKKLSLNSSAEHVFEPAPWAAWRASIHDAPVRPRRGLHLRYVLGDGNGVAYLVTPNGPIAWQVLSWNGSLIEPLLQAFSLLTIHADRRLGIGTIQHASVQGNLGEEEAESLRTQLDVPLTLVAGSGYSPRLVAFGLALGALSKDSNALDLAESLQEPAGLLARVPWADVLMTVVAFFIMHSTFSYYRNDVSQQLATVTQQNSNVQWAASLTQVQLNQELAFLQRQVSPLRTFVDRRLRFSSGLAAVAEELPSSTWLVSVSGEDLAWEKNPNKTLGERYLLLQIGAPAERQGEVPPEVNQTVRQLIDNEYLGSALKRIKLTDVIWQQRGGEGHSVFSILALPAN